MIKRSATNRAYGLVDPDAGTGPAPRSAARRRLRRSTRTLSLPAAALILGGLLMSGSLSAFSSPTDNAGNTWTAAASFGPEVTFGAVADTYAKQDKGGDDNFGIAVEMKVDSHEAKNKRSFVRFDISSIPAGSTIDSATLTLCATEVPAVARTYEVHRVTAAWVETILTWNLQPSVAATATDSATTPAAPGCMTWTVTADVQAWVDGTANDGWRVSDSVEGDAVHTEGKFRSREDTLLPAEHPKLDVTYTST